MKQGISADRQMLVSASRYVLGVFLQRCKNNNFTLLKGQSHMLLKITISYPER
jgi:hypothetical protein